MFIRIIFFLIFNISVYAAEVERFAELSIRMALEAVSKETFNRIKIEEAPEIVTLTKKTLINAIPKLSENLVFDNVTGHDLSLNVISTLSTEIFNKILPENQELTITSSSDSFRASYTFKF